MITSADIFKIHFYMLKNGYFETSEIVETGEVCLSFAKMEKDFIGLVIYYDTEKNTAVIDKETFTDYQNIMEYVKAKTEKRGVITNA